MMPPPCRFGTYMGKSGTTRAGYNGTINTNVLQTNSSNATQTATDGANGFGVFAYYTGRNTYGQYQGKTTYTGETQTIATTTDGAPNFMYNQRVYWDDTNYPTTSGYVSSWTYSPLKYWPNDFNQTDPRPVDDQEKDQSSNQAYGSTTYGGNLSLFAYAPYVFVTESTGTPISTKENYNDGSTVGITALTKNDDKGDPKVTYVLRSGSSLSNVDLLWGTYSGTTTNVLSGATNQGVAYSSSAAANTYQKAILPHSSDGGSTYDGYKLNADLTKQKTNGTVGFAFKHALASIGGGSNVSSGIGFQVVLDLDDLKGAETGGKREEFKVTSGNDAWRTIVTIKNIEISNDLNGDGSIDAGTEVAQATAGNFNLATGQWARTATGVVNQTIGTSCSSGTTYNAELSQKIAEYKTNTNTTHVSDYSSNYSGYFLKTLAAVNSGAHPGVTEVPQNVFEDANQTPLMIIPNSSESTFRITVDYIVRTYDEALSTPYTEVGQKISKKITFPANSLELNKHYNLIMHLGLTSVKFTATADNWDEGTIIDNNADGIKESDIYLPINVDDGTTAVSTNAGTSTTSVNVAATGTSYQITIEGLTTGATVAASSVSGTNIESVSSVSFDATTVPASGTVVATVTLKPNYTNQSVANSVVITETLNSATNSVTTIAITQLPDKKYTLACTPIAAAANSTGTITVTGATDPTSVTVGTITPSGLTATVDGKVVTLTAISANTISDKVFTVSLTINDGTSDYTYTTTVVQVKGE